MSEHHDNTRPPNPPFSPADPAGAVSVDLSGQLVVSAEVLAQAGLEPGQAVIVEATAEGVRIVPDALRKVHVEITSHCNLDCAMCVRHGWQEPLGHMPLARFERLVEGLPVVSAQSLTLAFSGFGEPLVHPAWQEMMRLARGRQHRVELITNGLLLDARAARTLVDLGVAQVTVSVDGGDEATYARMRGVPASAALAAVHYLLEARRHTRRPVAIGVAAVASRSTVASLPALLEWATDLRLDFVSIGNLVPHTEDMAGEILWEHAGWASAFRQASWRPRLLVGRFDAEEATRPLAIAVWGRGLTYPSPSVDEGRWRNRCRFAHEGMCAVSWDGRVSPCLSLLHNHTEYINAQTRRVHEHVVGHIDEQPLAAIWRDSAFREFRQRVRAFDFPACFHCGGCPLTETNDQDCYGNPAPVCGECLWAQGIVLCP
ncbi:MAG: radical SAM protein [Acidobacteria bacterium]|nr:radical SAM protein [Acidobacteriota bacterium]